MAVTDIRLHLSFKDHRKRKKLQMKLGESGVLGLIDLWLSCAVNRPDGVLTGYDESDIALDASYSGDAIEFCSVLESIGFIERVDGVFCLHGWEEKQRWVCGSEDRSDKARFSRLAKIDRKKFNELKDKGINALSRDEYDRLAKPQRTVNEPLTNFNDTVTPAPSPAPSPAPAHNVKELLSLTETNVISGRCPENYHSMFEEFWKVYPSRNGKKNGKRKAFEKWWAAIRDNKITHQKMMASIISMAPSYGDYAPDAAKWILGREWENEICVQPKPRTFING